MDAEQLKIDLGRITGQLSLVDGETIAQVLGRLDTCAQSSGIPDQLRHYLSKRSYVKAIAWLENPELPHSL